MDIITYALCRKNGGGGGGDNTHFIGTTTTAITDGATTNPITVDGESYTAVKGDIVIYDSAEFIFDGSAWQSFGGTMDTQPTKDSAKAVTSDGVYRYTAGQREYVSDELKGEIFNSYSGLSKNIASGLLSHAEGYGTTASGHMSHAEGRSNTASGYSSHAEGEENTVNGRASHAEGVTNTASGYGSHAEGIGNTASNDFSHVEGEDNTASGRASHAEGAKNTASGNYSHAGGLYTIANTKASTVIGKYNVADGTNVSDLKHLFIVGNGTGVDDRSNILEVSDTYMNLNGVFKQNGQVIDFSSLDEIVEMSDIEYDALATKDPDKVYFVYETEVDNRTITAYDSNGDFIYKLTMYGCASIGGISLDSKVTTPPTITEPNVFGSGSFIFKGTFADGNTYYFSSLFTDGRSGYSISNDSSKVSDAYGTNMFFVVNGNRFTLMTAPNAAWRSLIHISGYDESSFELAVTPKPNGFKRIYKGDELYATNELPDITPHVELTQSQYDALQNPDPNTEYFITNADASGDFSSIEDRMTAIEDEYTIVYMDGNVRIPLYTRNVYKVVRVDGNTVEWYITEPTSQRNFKATVTATGSAGTRTNPTVTVTEVV